MKSENRYVRDFVVDGYPFRFLVTNANQLVLLNMTHHFDEWGDELPFDMYRPLGAELGAKVYRQCFKYALDAIFGLRFGFQSVLRKSVSVCMTVSPTASPTSMVSTATKAAVSFSSTVSNL